MRNKVAIIDALSGQTRTFRDYYSDMGSIASHLLELGIDQDSTIALFSPNHVDYVPICLAAAVCGAQLSPINPTYKVDEVQAVLRSSGADTLFFHCNNAKVAMEAIKGGTAVKHVIFIPTQDGDCGPLHVSISQGTHIHVYSLSDMKHHSNPTFETHPSIRNNTSTKSYLLPYSSGTTGMPKCVRLSHHNIVSNLLQLEAIEAIAFPPNQTLISPLPFFHIYGWLVSALYSAWQGQELITMQRFDMDKFCQAVEKYRPKRAHLVPPIIIQLAKKADVEKYDLSSLDMIICGAAPLSKETEQDLFDRIGCKTKQAWGMSEISPVGTFTSDYNIRRGSVGQLVSDTVGKIVDPISGRSLGPGKSGELMIRGPQVMMGYLNDEEKTRECLTTDGWIRTGDLATYDDDGFFYITGRIKEIINVRGYQVPPAELESVLLTHPKVSDAAVIPVPDDISGELPRAYVSLKEGLGFLTEDEDDVLQNEIKTFVRDRVAPFKRLEGGVKFIDQIPKSSSGKILRRQLLDLLHAEGP